MQKRKLTCEQPIKFDRTGTALYSNAKVWDYLGVEYINEEGELVLQEFSGETSIEDAQHFIIMFEYEANKDWLHYVHTQHKEKGLITNPVGVEVGYAENNIPSTRELIAKVVTGIGEVLQEKNKRYGDSALNELKIFKDKCKVGGRMDDKLARIKNADELKKNDLCDLIGYGILACIEKGWTDFQDQID